MKNDYRRSTPPYSFDPSMYNPNNYSYDTAYLSYGNNSGYDSDNSNHYLSPYEMDQNKRNQTSQDDENENMELMDYGPDALVININEASKQNDTFRTALWTGNHLQVTLMSIDVGDDIGLEIHPKTEQFIRIEEGEGIVQMGNQKDRLTFMRKVSDDDAFIVPAGVWHNLTNTGDIPLKLYSIYAPPQHPHGTVHETKEDARESK
ncbi:cupin domain-containing protein [Anaeromicropila herbilytica]|uniref:Cupin n=2 Tax=Anaeromicropila herbilytica TaxID=2785025 RepID=A0A7R7EIM8_9FIRM|nr:cupin domain-containing protein [Anaeromicropila herbilytica]BCN29386.1 cupin [Anaeromicropila herbilytica]